MTAVSWSYALFKHPIRWMTRAMTIIDKPEADQADITAAPVVYVMRSNAKSDFAILQRSARENQLPDPQQPLYINGKSFDRVLLLPERDDAASARALSQFQALLEAHQADPGAGCTITPSGGYFGAASPDKRPTREMP